MNPRQPHACPQRITVTTLSAWRDGDLSATTANHLREHVAGCAVCQETIAVYATLGATLQRGVALEHHEATRRQDRIWRSLRARILWHQGGRFMHTPRALIWRGVGAAAIVLVVAVVALQLLGKHTPHVAQVPHATATVSQRPLDPAIAALPTLTHAWGAHAITYSTPIGANSNNDPVFQPADIAPDGSLVVGYGYSDSQSLPSSIDMLTVATGKTQQLTHVTFSTSAFVTEYSTGIVKTDGRYVVWLNQATTDWQIGIYDVQHGTQTSLTAQSTGENFTFVSLDHGRLLWIDQHKGLQSRYSLKTTDLGTMVTTDIVPQANFSYFSATSNWPYVFYSDVPSSSTRSGSNPATTSFLYNLATHTQVVIPATQANNGYVLVGATLYRQEYNTNGSVTSLQVDQMQDADQAGAAWQKLLTLPWSDGNTTAETRLTVANGRLLIFQRAFTSEPLNLIAWDMQQQHLILVEPANISLVGVTALHGDWLAYLSTDSATTYSLHIINTAQLPS